MAPARAAARGDREGITPSAIGSAEGQQPVSSAGALVAFLVRFFGFMVVAGDMWQSKIRNGQDAALRFYISVLAVLNLLNQSDPDLPASAEPGGTSS